MRPTLLAVALFSALMAAAALTAATNQHDWPAWRGADRTGISRETGLLHAWPKEGPKLVWTAKKLGDGWSTPSIVGDRIYLMGAVDKQEVVMALDASDGAHQWTSKSVGKSEGGYPGPRSTPTVDGERMYLVSSNGELNCLDVKSGDIVWTKSFKKDFGGRAGSWAYAESPLVDGDVLIVTPGGPKAFMVALKKSSGETIWSATSEQLPSDKYSVAGYSSAIVADVRGEKQYIQFVNGGVVGVAAADGKVRWHYDHPANSTANISTPIFRDNVVFAASAYKTGGGAATITRDGDKFEAQELYFVKELQNHHGGILLIGDHVYGTGGGTLMCIDFKTGKIEWQNRGVGKGSVAFADGYLVVRGEKDEIALVEATPKEYKEVGRFKQPDRSNQPAWPHPVIANGRLYIRDWDQMMCYDVKN